MEWNYEYIVCRFNWIQLYPPASQPAMLSIHPSRAEEWVKYSGHGVFANQSGSQGEG